MYNYHHKNIKHDEKAYGATKKNTKIVLQLGYYTFYIDLVLQLMLQIVNIIFCPLCFLYYRDNACENKINLIKNWLQ